jgi:diguanylate cyclase (GGDEF)-like protein
VVFGSGGSARQAANGTIGSRTPPLITPFVVGGPLALLSGQVAGIGNASGLSGNGTGAKTAASQSATQGTASTARRHSLTALDPAPTDALTRIERVVPTGVWIALALALAVAAVAGGTALWSAHRMRRQSARFAMVSAAALTDSLTGVLNRRGFAEAAERELARARRHDRPFTLAYVDVRGLKAVNDTQGHRAGDELLKQTARLLKDSARAVDVVGRIGGDELAMMLVEQDGAGAEVVKGRIARDIAARRAAMGLRAPWDLTIGTAVFPEDGETVDELLRTADRRLYEQRGIALG